MKHYFRIACLLAFFTPCIATASFFESDKPQQAISGSGATFETAFAPGNKLSETTIKEIKSATKNIKVAAHRFVSKDVSIALIQAGRSGKDVQVVLDKMDKDDGNSAAGFFVNMSNPPHIVEHYDAQYQDYMVIDDKDLIIGNISSIEAAEDEKKNSAGVLIIHNAPELAKAYAANWQKLWDGSKKLENENLLHIHKDGSVTHD